MQGNTQVVYETGHGGAVDKVIKPRWARGGRLKASGEQFAGQVRWSTGSPIVTVEIPVELNNRRASGGKTRVRSAPDSTRPTARYCNKAPLS